MNRFFAVAFFLALTIPVLVVNASTAKPDDVVVTTTLERI